MRESMNCMHPVVAIAPAAATADNTPWVGGWIDRSGYESLTYVFATGIEADADATFAVTMQHADLDDHSDAVAVASTDLVGTLALAGFTFADDGEARKVGYVGGKKWNRITVTPTNNAGNAFLAALAILGDAALEPTPNPPA